MAFVKKIAKWCFFWFILQA